MAANPYQPPLIFGRDETTFEHRGSLKREVLFLLLAAVSFFVVGTVGAALVSHFGIASEPLIGDTSIAATLWFRWVAKIVGRLCGDYLSGALIGRYLHRIIPHNVVVTFMLVPLLVIAIN